MNPRGDDRAIALRGPHLVLAHVRDDDAVFGRRLKQFVEKSHRRLRQSAWIEFRSVGSASHCAPLAANSGRCALQLRMERRNRFREIADHRQSRKSALGQVAPDQFQSARSSHAAQSASGRRSRDRPAAPENQQQVGFVQSHVGGARSVHADHAQVIRSLRLNRAQSVHCCKCRDIQLVQQLPQASESRPTVLRPRRPAPPASSPAAAAHDQCRVKADFGLRFRTCRACGVNFTGPGNSIFAFKKSVGMSITTGPGRPLRAQ